MMDEDTCRICGVICSVESDFDTSIWFGQGDDDVVCRGCYDSGSYLKLDASTQAEILVEEAYYVDDIQQQRVLVERAIELKVTHDLRLQVLLALATTEVLEVEKLFRKILAADPNNVTANFSLPGVLAIQGRFEEALEFIAVRDTKFSDPEAVFDSSVMQAMLIRDRGAPKEESERLFKEAISRYPHDAVREGLEERWVDPSPWRWQPGFRVRR